MDLPWAKKKNELSEEELLDEIKKEATNLTNSTSDTKKPLPLPPMLKKPLGTIHLPSSAQNTRGMLPPPRIQRDPVLSTQEVAKLPHLAVHKLLHLAGYLPPEENHQEPLEFPNEAV